MKILVTGGRGFIGNHLLPILISLGHEVFVITSSAALKSDNKIKWIQADLMSPVDIESVISKIQPDALIGLAWYTEHGKFWSSRNNFDWVLATQNLVTAFQKMGGKIIVMAGSCAEYDWSQGLCIEDHTPTLPNSLYGLCKNHVHSWLSIFCNEFNITLIWTRIFFPYGPGEPAGKFIPTILDALSSNIKPLKCSHGEQYRDFIHVSDVAEALSFLLFANVSSGTYNICSGEPIKISRIVMLCANYLRVKPEVSWGAIVVPKNDPLFLFGSNQKLREIGWTPKISLEDGLKNYASIYC